MLRDALSVILWEFPPCPALVLRWTHEEGTSRDLLSNLSETPSQHPALHTPHWLCSSDHQVHPPSSGRLQGSTWVTLPGHSMQTLPGQWAGVLEGLASFLVCIRDPVCYCVKFNVLKTMVLSIWSSLFHWSQVCGRVRGKNQALSLTLGCQKSKLLAA